MDVDNNAKEERRGYVEGVVKRVVRDNVGHAEGREGERDLGRSVGEREVRALEGVVGQGGGGGDGK